MTGLIPAAGNAERFGGLEKFLLPVGRDGIPAIVNCARTLLELGCTSLVVVTTAERVGIISSKLARFNTTPISYVIGGESMWESLLNGIRTINDYIVISMPDTVVEIKNPPLKWETFHMGLFYTPEPQKFSVYDEFKKLIITKDVSLRDGFAHRAWGIIGIDQNFARKALLTSIFADYDEAFNYLLNKYNDIGDFHIDSYYDIGNFKDYRYYLKCLDM